MAMKYRTLKETYKDYVGVFRSHIHGRGLYCTKDIEAGKCGDILIGLSMQELIFILF